MKKTDNRILTKEFKYRDKTNMAMEEGKRISKDKNVKGYTNMEDLKAALDKCSMK